MGIFKKVSFYWMMIIGFNLPLRSEEIDWPKIEEFIQIALHEGYKDCRLIGPEIWKLFEKIEESSDPLLVKRVVALLALVSNNLMIRTSQQSQKRILCFKLSAPDNDCFYVRLNLDTGQLAETRQSFGEGLSALLSCLNVQIPQKLNGLVLKKDVFFDWIKKTEGQNGSLFLENLDNDHSLRFSGFMRNPDNLSAFLEKALIVFQGSGSSDCRDFHHKVQMFGQMILLLDPSQPQQIAKQLVSFLEQERNRKN